MTISTYKWQKRLPTRPTNARFVGFSSPKRPFLPIKAISYNFLHRPTNLQTHQTNNKQHNILIYIYIHIRY